MMRASMDKNGHLPLIVKEKTCKIGSTWCLNKETDMIDERNGKILCCNKHSEKSMVYSS
jgi:hypothetical protein